jgi:hypothetical protein
VKTASIRIAAKTVGTLALLQAALPVNAALTGVALLRSRVVKAPPQRSARPKTILISGGKMTKALQLARSFHADGHRVILVESAKYRLTGHRFSNAVDRFYTVPKPQSSDYAEALLDIVRRENVDVYVPVCSPAASYYDALAKPLLEPWCEVLHADADLVRTLDDKYEFAVLAGSLGLPVPDAHRVSAPHEAHVRRQPLDHAVADPRPGVLHAQHGPGRRSPGLLLRRLVRVPNQLRDGR